MSVLVKFLLFLPAVTYCGDVEWTNIVSATFHRIDVNKDGLINRTEMDNYIKGYDTNGDGKTNKKECTDAIVASLGRNKAVLSTFNKLVDAMDFNGDGQLDTKDSDKLFVKADGGDKEVNRIEFTGWFLLAVALVDQAQAKKTK